MIKRTLYFGNPAYLHLERNQLVVSKPDGSHQLEKDQHVIPIEDIGIVVLDHPRITFTHAVINSLTENNAIMIWCDDKHMPNSVNIPLAKNDTYTEKLRHQIQATEPLKKQLWKQTMESKIYNQSIVLKLCGYPHLKLEKMISRINSGDSDNYEAQAAAIYWQHILKPYDTTRGRFEAEPNHFFNYGYAILRSIIARN